MLAPIPIHRISPPSIAEFYKNYVRANRPVVISNMVDDWPALQLWSNDYFAQAYGDTLVTVQRLRDGKVDLSTDKGVNAGQMALRNAIETIKHAPLDNNWLISSEVSTFPPQIRKEYHVPAYCADGRFLTSRLFISPAGMRSTMHQDLPENIYVMVKGVKRIILFAPGDPVYHYSRFSKLLNHAQADPEHPDYERFPKFRNAQPYITDLRAGEVLFIPTFWWHHIRHLEASVSINFWWSRGWMVPLGWAGMTYARLRKIGNHSPR